MVTIYFNTNEKELCPSLAHITSFLLTEIFCSNSKMGSYFCIFIGSHNYFFIFLRIFPSLPTELSLLACRSGSKRDSCSALDVLCGQHLPGNRDCSKAAVWLCYFFLPSFLQPSLTGEWTVPEQLPKQWKLSDGVCFNFLHNRILISFQNFFYT